MKYVTLDVTFVTSHVTCRTYMVTGNVTYFRHFLLLYFSARFGFWFYYKSRVNYTTVFRCKQIENVSIYWIFIGYLLLFQFLCVFWTVISVISVIAMIRDFRRVGAIS